MTQIEMVAKVAAEARITKAAAGRIIDFIGRAIVADLLLDGRSSYPGLGIFYVVERGPRVFRNPATGGQVKKPAQKVVKFKVLAAVKKQFAP